MSADTARRGDVADGAVGDGGVDALTMDGGIITIRAVHDSDRDRLAVLYRDATPESLRLRFFHAPSPASLAAEVDRLCRPNTDRHLALLAEENGSVVGVASYGRLSGADRRGEFAVFVAEHHRGRGIGTLLLEHLAARAHAHGVTDLIGEVLAGNLPMLRVARELSGHAWSRFADGIVDVSLATADDDTVQLAVDQRERIAERESLRAVLCPAAVAIVGAGHRSDSVGRQTLRALRDYGFAGRLYAVNSDGRAVDGLTAYRSVGDLPAPVDCW